MCRFLAYLGAKEIVLSKIIEEPDNSLIKQSLNSKEGMHKVNADGFGVCWYNNLVGNKPGVFRSTSPAWNDKNLISISHIIQSNCILGHVRAATFGDITIPNCHPFSYEQYSFVHNGSIKNFEKVRKLIVNELDDELYNAIDGKTDSEHFFFLIMQFLKQDKNQDMESALLKAIKWLDSTQSKMDKSDYSNLNIAITDGKKLIVTRYSSKKNSALSLSYILTESQEILENQKSHESILIASEPLTNFKKDWNEVKPNHYIIFDIGNGMEIKKID